MNIIIQESIANILFEYSMFLVDTFKQNPALIQEIASADEEQLNNFVNQLIESFFNLEYEEEVVNE
jgi:hypothetical protein